MIINETTLHPAASQQSSEGKRMFQPTPVTKGYGKGYGTQIFTEGG